MRRAALLAFLVLPSCGEPDTEPAGLEEFCRLDANAKSPAEKCGPLLVCNYFYSAAKPDIEADTGYCTYTCRADADCPGGQRCLSQACFYTCASANCPHDWMSCKSDLLEGEHICVGAPL